MTEQELQRIETTLQVTLPIPYREMSLNFPFEPIGRDWIYWLYDHADSVIASSQFPLEDGEYDQQNWKQSYVVVGESACGDLHLIDTLLPDPPVLLLSHEDHSIVEEWADIVTFISYWHEETRQAEKCAAERKHNQEVEKRRTNRLLLAMLILVLVCTLLAYLIGVSHRAELKGRQRKGRLNPQSSILDEPLFRAAVETNGGALHLSGTQ